MCCVSEEKLTAVIRRTVNCPDPLLNLTLRFGKKASIRTSIRYENNLRNRGKARKRTACHVQTLHRAEKTHFHLKKEVPSLDTPPQR